MAYDITIKDRIRSYVSTLGLSDRDFERRAGVSQSFLSSSSEPSGKAITSILNAFPELNPDYLILGISPMLRTPSNLRRVAEVVPSPSATPAHDGVAASSEPTSPYHSPFREDITLPKRVFEEMLTQLKNKDQQLQDAAAQIATLLQTITTLTHKQ